jgi:hypothetical protein
LLLFVEGLIVGAGGRGDWGVIPEEELEGAVGLTSGPRVGSIGGGNVLRAEFSEELVSEVGRFADALQIHEAETAVERAERRAVFFEDVSEGPIRHGLSERRGFAEFLEDKRGFDVLVVDEVSGCVRAAPLGVMEFEFGRGGSVDEGAGLLDVAGDGSGLYVEDGAGVAVGVEGTLGDGVGVGGEEIRWNVVGVNVLKPFRLPASASGRQTDRMDSAVFL